MNPIAMLFGLALLAFSAFYIASPLRFKNPPRQPVRRETSANQRQSVLLALRDLDFDYQASKVADGDYQTLRTELLNEAAQLIQGQDQDRQKEEALEALIESRRKARSTLQPVSKVKLDGPTEKVCQNCQAPLQDDAKFCSKCGVSIEKAVCPKCGKSIQPGDLFCPSCGTSVKSVKQTAAAVGE